MTAEDLAQRLVETRKELFNIRFQAATGALEDMSKLRQTRREIRSVRYAYSSPFSSSRHCFAPYASPTAIRPTEIG